jgi:hypothetical protein
MKAYPNRLLPVSFVDWLLRSRIEADNVENVDAGRRKKEGMGDEAKMDERRKDHGERDGCGNLNFGFWIFCNVGLLDS